MEHHAILAFSRFQRNIAIDHVIQNPFWRAAKRVAITTPARWVKRHMGLWCKPDHGLGWQRLVIVLRKFTQRAWLTPRQPLRSKLSAVDHGRDAPRPLSPIADLRRLTQAATLLAGPA